MNQVRPSELASKINKIGLLIGVIFPIAILVGAWLLRTTWSPAQRPQNWFQVLLLIVVALSDPVIDYFVLKPTLMKPENILRAAAKQKTAALQQVVSSSVAIFGMVAAPSVLGLVTYLMWAGFAYFTALTAVSLLAYLLLRPKNQEIEDLMREIAGIQQSSGSPSA